MLEQQLLHYGYLFIMVGTMLEGDGTVLTAAFLAHRGYFHLWLVILTSALTTIAADQVYYEVARRHGRKAVEERLAATPRVAQVIAWVERRGTLLLLASRFLPGFRIAVPAACGAVGMHRVRFSIVNVAGGLVWAGGFALGGYYGAGLLTILIADIRKHERIIAFAILVLIAAYILWRSRAQEPKEVWTAVRHPEDLAAQSLTVLAQPEALGRNRLTRWQQRDYRKQEERMRAKDTGFRP